MIRDWPVIRNLLGDPRIFLKFPINHEWDKELRRLLDECEKLTCIATTEVEFDDGTRVWWHPVITARMGYKFYTVGSPVFNGKILPALPRWRTVKALDELRKSALGIRSDKERLAIFLEELKERKR